MDSITLRRAIQSFARLDHEGLLDEYRTDLADAWRGPAADLDRHPEWRYSVAKFARIASQIFGVPAADAQRAAIDALLPDTREIIALELLEQYEQRMDEQALKAQAKRKIQSFNRRVGA